MTLFPRNWHCVRSCCATWCDTLEANKSTVRVPNFRQRLRKTCQQRTHLDESTLRPDSKSATLLSELGRYSTVIMICFEINISQIWFDSIVIFWFLVPWIFFKYVKGAMLSIFMWIEVKFLLLRNVWWASFTASSSSSLICYFLSWNDHVPRIDLPWRAAPQTVNEASFWNTTCGTWKPEKSHWKSPKFLSTIEVPISSCYSKLCLPDRTSFLSRLECAVVGGQLEVVREGQPRLLT